MTRGRLRGADVEHPFRGISTAGLDLSTIEGVGKAFQPLMRAEDAISHTSAALLFGAPLPDAEPELLPLHVTSVGVRAHRGRNLIGHEWDESLRLDAIHGIRVVAPADMWCQLSTMMSREDLVAVGDFLVSGVPLEGRNMRTPPWCTVAGLRDAVRRHGRRAGARNLAWAIERVRVGADSRPETLLRLLLVAAGLPEPLLNDPVQVRNGKRYKPDLKHKQWGTLYEYEGIVHLRTPRQWRFDTWRYQQFEEVGWKVVRVNAEHLFADPRSFITFVYGVLLRRARELGVAPPVLAPKWLR